MENSQMISKLLSFLDASPSPYHAVDQLKNLLLSSDFISLAENKSWHIQKGQKYCFTRNGSALVAFAIGSKYVPQFSL
jgi:aspartyl aminopeptidase